MIPASFYSQFPNKTKTLENTYLIIMKWAITPEIKNKTPPCLMAKQGFLWHRSNFSILLALYNLWANSVEFCQNPRFCRLCYISWKTFPMISIYYRGKFEPYGTVQNKFRDFKKNSSEFHLNFRVFQKKTMTTKIFLRISRDSYIGIFRSFGIISEISQKIPSFVFRIRWACRTVNWWC